MTASTPTRDSAPAQPRRTGLIVVAVLLMLQVLAAVIVAFGPRPGPYGWQMYSATPFKPNAWAVRADTAERLSVDDLLVNDRTEIDYVALLRTHGCEVTGADAIRIELADSTIEEVACR
jgi:hypothetical protein